jgi:hypothetical protein
VLNLESTATSRSQVLTFNVRQRFSVFTANASYSHYSQYNDSDGFFSTPADNYNLRSDWGRSTTPVHQINGTVNAKLFMGVFLTGSVTANSGNLYNVTTGDDDNHDSNINDRPANTLRTAAMVLDSSISISISPRHSSCAALRTAAPVLRART